MRGFFPKEDADRDIRIFRPENLLPEIEEFLGQFFLYGGLESVPCQWSKPPLIPPWIIKGKGFVSRNRRSEVRPWPRFFECRRGCQDRLLIAGFADDVETDWHPVGVEATRDAGGGEADGVDRMRVR